MSVAPCLNVKDEKMKEGKKEVMKEGRKKSRGREE